MFAHVLFFRERVSGNNGKESIHAKTPRIFYKALTLPNLRCALPRVDVEYGSK